MRTLTPKDITLWGDNVWRSNLRNTLPALNTSDAAASYVKQGGNNATEQKNPSRLASPNTAGPSINYNDEPKAQQKYDAYPESEKKKRTRHFCYLKQAQSLMSMKEFEVYYAKVYGKAFDARYAEVYGRSAKLISWVNRYYQSCALKDFNEKDVASLLSIFNPINGWDDLTIKLAAINANHEKASSMKFTVPEVKKMRSVLSALSVDELIRLSNMLIFNEEFLEHEKLATQSCLPISNEELATQSCQPDIKTQSPKAASSEQSFTTDQLNIKDTHTPKSRQMKGTYTRWDIPERKKIVWRFCYLRLTDPTVINMQDYLDLHENMPCKASLSTWLNDPYCTSPALQDFAKKEIELLLKRVSRKPITLIDKLEDIIVNKQSASSARFNVLEVERMRSALIFAGHEKLCKKLIYNRGFLKYYKSAQEQSQAKNTQIPLAKRRDENNHDDPLTPRTKKAQTDSTSSSSPACNAGQQQSQAVPLNKETQPQKASSPSLLFRRIPKSPLSQVYPPQQARLRG